MTDISKEAVDVLLQGVTEGSWTWNVRGFVGPASMEDDQSFGMICDEVAECTYSDGSKEANARFIAAARELVPALRAALDEAEDRIRKICLDALISYGQVEAERDALAAQLDAATALLRDGLLTVQTGRNEPLVIWSETVAAHLGAKP